MPHIFKRNRTSVVKINFIKLNVYSRNKDTLWKKCIDPSINRECDKRAHISEKKLSQSPRISLHNITVSFLKSCGRHKLSTLLEEIPETAEPYINSVRRSRSFLPGVRCQELKAASLSLSLSSCFSYTDSIRKPLELAKQPRRAQLDKLTSMCMRGEAHGDRS